MASPSNAYIMGHTDHERRRLALQAQALNPITHDFFVRAGIAPGMRVLDLGCGVGEVSLIAARLVGPSGSVTGLDIDPGGLEIARDRAKLVEAILRFTAPHPDFEWRQHPMFGNLSRWQWMRWGYLHTDHHLRQFGVQ